MDVYEELGRLAAANDDWLAAPRPDPDQLRLHGERKATLLEAQHLVEFLRWRDPAKEWPADGCRCLVVVDGKDPLFGQQNRGPFVTMASNVTRIDGPARWRYILGPCSCGTAGTEGA